jgi:hypothetical protein
VTPEKAFAEYRKTRPTFDVKPAFVDGWRMGRMKSLWDAIREIDSIPADSSDEYDALEKAVEAVRTLLEADDG